MHVWIPKQGWFPVADIIDYHYKTDDLGTYRVADVVLFDGSIVWNSTLQYNLFYNLQE